MRETASIVEVIRVVSKEGTGQPEDPTRMEVAYWSKDGHLIASMDINDDPLWRGKCHDEFAVVTPGGDRRVFPIG